MSSGQQQKINCVHVKRWQRRAQVAPGFFMWNPSSQVFIGGQATRLLDLAVYEKQNQAF
ncbi:hypothetical protein L917_11132 [Phytophthora nicotianae]|uniref:Uncharacterized protein n=1 Tax=Phytophthora nicotianae TaxID=4792 RepID=W2KY58_PHYNI|nr:hypothetical protein L917_11132 [Phytophthora nicotianae]